MTIYNKFEIKLHVFEKVPLTVPLKYCTISLVPIPVLFCSQKCPPQPMMKAYLMTPLRKFHSSPFSLASVAPPTCMAVRQLLCNAAVCGGWRLRIRRNAEQALSARTSLPAHRNTHIEYCQLNTVEQDINTRGKFTEFVIWDFSEKFLSQKASTVG